MAVAHADPWASMHARAHGNSRAASCHACRGLTWPPTVKTRIHQGAPSLLIVPFSKSLSVPHSKSLFHFTVSQNGVTFQNKMADACCVPFLNCFFFVLFQTGLSKKR